MKLKFECETGVSPLNFHVSVKKSEKKVKKMTQKQHKRPSDLFILKIT